MVYEQSLVLSKILTGEKKNAPLLRKASFHLDAHVCMVQKKKESENKLKKNSKTWSEFKLFTKQARGKNHRSEVTAQNK